MSDTDRRKPRRQSSSSSDFSIIVDDLQGVLDGIPDRPSKGLMTFEELQAKFGAKPKKDRFFGLKKMSVRYKAIGEKLQAVKDTLASATLGDIEDQGGRQNFEQLLNARLDEVDDACARYQKKHKGSKSRAVQDLRDDAQRFRDEIPRALDKLLGGEEARLPDDLKVDSALAAQRAGIKPAQMRGVSGKHCEFAKFNDETSDGPPVHLAKGNVNSVQLVSHGGVERVFKKEQQTDTSRALAPQFMGIDVKNNPRYGNRNVAGGVLGKMLGATVMPDSKFAISNGEVGLLMDKAPGKTLQKLIESGDIDDIALSPKALASLQKQLMDMEACDLLTGQTDRHFGNYMIDVSGDSVTVTAIDNDFSFPDPDSDAVNMNPQYAEIPPKFYGMNSIRSLPALLSREIAGRILAIDFNRDLAPEYEGLLTEPEIRGARARFQVMQNHVRQLDQNGYIVDNWETWTAPPPDDGMTATAFLRRDGAENKSLFGRDFDRL